MNAESTMPHPEWIVPDWPAPAHVRALITTRAGGVSEGAYESLNLGLGSGDDIARVEENRRRLRAVLPQEPRWLRQVHGARVVAADTLGNRPEADAALARHAGTVCAVMIADCLPILLCNRSGTVVAAAHAGWRGLAGGVIGNVVSEMGHAGAQPGDILAYIGPGIGPSAFEVGADVRDAYVGRDAAAAVAFAPKIDGKWLANLPWLACRALERAGVMAVYGGDLCTYSDPKRFFSYRRDRVTGRMAALVWRETRSA